MPRHANEQRPVVPEVRRPPVLGIRHQALEVLNHGIQIKAFELFGVIEFLAHRIRQRGVLMQNSQVQLFRPPIPVRRSYSIGVMERTLRFGLRIFFVWHISLSVLGDVSHAPLLGKANHRLRRAPVSDIA